MNMREVLNRLDEISRRGFLKGIGAAGVAAAGLTPNPAKAWFFFFIPLPNLSPDAAANACMPGSVTIGQKVNIGGEILTVQKIHGVSNRCPDPNMPVAVTAVKLEPAGPPVVKEPPTQTLPSENYGKKIIDTILPNLIYSGPTEGNPRTLVEVSVSNDGTISKIRLVESSGVSEWDEAVLKAIQQTRKLPPDSNGSYIPVLMLTFTPVSVQQQQSKNWKKFT